MPRAFKRGAAAIRQSRLTQWLDLPPTVTAFGASGGTIILSLSTAEKALRPFTIVRTRMLIGIVSDQLAAGENQLGALGIAVVSDQASAIGVTAVPTPVTDLSSDLWLLHQFLFNTFSIASAVGYADDGMHQYAVDSKAMRKVQDGEDVVVVGELDGANSSGFSMTIAGRMLVKLH